jgi:hypothetical protein
MKAFATLIVFAGKTEPTNLTDLNTKATDRFSDRYDDSKM